MYIMLSLLILAAGLLLLFLSRWISGGAVLIPLRLLGLVLVVSAVTLLWELTAGKVTLPLW